MFRCTWEKVQRVFIQKMKLVVDEFYENHPYKDGKINPNFENDPYNEMKERLIQLAEKFERYLEQKQLNCYFRLKQLFICSVCSIYLKTRLFDSYLFVLNLLKIF